MTDRQTGQKQYNPDHSMLGHKNEELCHMFKCEQVHKVKNYFFVPLTRIKDFEEMSKLVMFLR